MDWDAVSAVSEAVGALAVVITLIYLAVQVRQNTRAVRSAMLQDNTALWTSVFCNLAEKDLAAAYAVGMSGTAEPDPAQYTQFFLICRGMFVAMENQYYQYRQGVLDKSTYLGYEKSISRQMLAFPGFRIWWEQNHDIFSSEFTEYVDGMIESVPEGDPGSFLEEWQTIAQRRSLTRT